MTDYLSAFAIRHKSAKKGSSTVSVDGVLQVDVCNRLAKRAGEAAKERIDQEEV